MAAPSTALKPPAAKARSVSSTAPSAAKRQKAVGHVPAFGARVEIRWPQNVWFKGTVAAVGHPVHSANAFRVHFDDGDEHWITPEHQWRALDDGAAENVAVTPHAAGDGSHRPGSSSSGTTRGIPSPTEEVEVEVGVFEVAAEVVAQGEPHVLQQGQPANPTADPTPPLIKPWEADEDTPTSKLCGMVKRPGVQSVSGNIVESTDIKNSVLLLSHDEKEDVLTAYARQPWFLMADIETLQRVVREDDTATPEDVVAVDAELAKFVGAMGSSEDQGAARVALKRLRAFIRSLSRERSEETHEKKLTLLERHWSEYVWSCIERAQDPTAIAP